jgi:hypothetical protein
MVWGMQRLNAKKTQPNGNIVFIKPLPGPDEEIAKDYLERIAAQCCTSPNLKAPVSAAPSLPKIRVSN